MSSFASRLITALLGVALIVLFWPSWLPVGFPQAWWVSELTRPDPLPSPSKALFTKPGTSPAEAPSAVPAQPAEPASALAPTPTTAPGTATMPKTADAPASIPAPASKQAHAILPPTAKPDKATEANAAAVADAAPTAAVHRGDEIMVAPPGEPKLTYRVVVRDGGTLEAAGVLISLGGIHARDADATCKDKHGRTWQCGAQARAALSRLIRGRAVRCEPPATGAQKSVTARCAVGTTDLATWMVTQGWAVPSQETEAKFAKAVQAARKKGAGLWR